MMQPTREGENSMTVCQPMVMMLAFPCRAELTSTTGPGSRNRRISETGRSFFLYLFMLRQSGFLPVIGTVWSLHESQQHNNDRVGEWGYEEQHAVDSVDDPDVVRTKQSHHQTRMQQGKEDHKQAEQMDFVGKSQVGHVRQVAFRDNLR